MDFLALAQRVRQEVGAAGSGPSSVTSQVGEAKRIVDYVPTAWLEIQSLHDSWSFLRGYFSFTTTDGQGEYTPAQAGITDLRYWYWDTFRCYPTAAGVNGEIELDTADYDSFKRVWRYGNRPSGQPIVATERPNDRAIMLGPIPAAPGYTIYGDYQKSPVTLVSATDVPNIPSDLHMVIVYKAMQYFALYEGGAPDVMARGTAGYNALIGRMQRELLPPMLNCSPLA